MNGAIVALVLRFSENKNSSEYMLFTTNNFVATLFKHLRSCQFTGELVRTQLASCERSVDSRVSQLLQT